jgi:hypothetical protein
MPAPFSKRLAREAAPARPEVRSSAQVQSAPPAAEAAPLKLPETPVVPDIGNASQQVAIPVAAPAAVTQVLSPLEVTVEPAGEGAGPFSPSAGPLSCHAGVNRGNIAQVESPQGLEAQIAQFLADRGGNLSRPAGHPEARRIMQVSKMTRTARRRGENARGWGVGRASGRCHGPRLCFESLLLASLL